MLYWDVYTNGRGRGGGVGGGGGGGDLATRKVTDTKVVGKAAEVGAEGSGDKKGDGHESVTEDISKVATHEIINDQISVNRNMDNEGVTILQVYKT